MTNTMVERSDSDEKRRVRLATNVVAPCVALAFKPHELVAFSTVIVTAGEISGAASPIELRLETSAGDVQRFWVWQPDVPSLATLEGMKHNLLLQLDEWMPTSRLRWGDQSTLS